MRVANVSGDPHPELRPGQQLDLIAQGATLLRSTLEECTTAVVEDWQGDARVNQPLARRWGVGAAVVTCLCAEERRLGVLMLSRATPYRWPAAALELAEALAAQAAVAIEKANLYEERRRAYQELKDAQARMIQSEKLAAVGTFASGLAHEVRNPLNSIALQVSLLERRTGGLDAALAGRIREVTGIVREEVKRLDSLVNDFLLFSRPTRIEYRTASLGAIADEVVRLLEPEAGAGRVALRRETPGPPAPEIRVDSERVKQVVINLVRNAIEAMPGGGEVVVEDGVADGHAVLRVSDDGPGLPEGVDVFQLFVTTKPKGTGLGLSIAQQIVLDHGGRITATSAPGEGATFGVHLPLPRPEPQGKEEQP